AALANRLLVEPHRIRERRLEQVVVTGEQPSHHVGERIASVLFQLRERSNVAAAEEQRLERPYGPERHDGEKRVVLADDSLRKVRLELRVVAKQTLTMARSVPSEGVLLARRLVGDRFSRPDLTVRMWIAGPHHRSAILEN